MTQTESSACGIAEISASIPSDRQWASRVERLLVTIEQEFKGVELLKCLRSDERIIVIARGDRLSILRRIQRTKLRYFAYADVGFCSRSEFNQYLTVSGSRPTIGNAPHLSSVLTGSVLASAFDDGLLIKVCQASGAFNGRIVPYEADQFLDAVSDVASNYSKDDPKVIRLKERLPRLQNVGWWNFTAQEQPPELGWLNYWNPATRKFMGFPEDFKDDAMFQYSYEGPEGSVIFKLTEEPLDLTRDDHIPCYANALKRFPRFACLAPSK